MARFTKARCKNCNKVFYRPARRFNEAIKFGWNQFCSLGCQYKYRTKERKILTCEKCGKKIIRTPSDISPHNYCSHSCAAVINNKKYDHRRILPSFKTCQQCRKKYRKSTGNKKYCSLKCRKLATERSPKDLIEIIKSYVKKENRIPSKRELHGINDSCRKTFGSWNNAIVGAGFIPNRSHDNRMYKRANAKAKDGHLCDSVSELLIDNWLFKNRIAHKKDVLYPETNHKADWSINLSGNKIFVEYFGLANDSPRYDRSIKEKEMLCKKQNISLIAIYPKDLYPKIYLDFNLKEKFRYYLLN